MPSVPDTVAPRRLTFRSGHRERFWQRNVLAVGQSAGFLEPLEASAIVMIELALDALVRNFPRTRAVMDLQAKAFNTLFRYRWDRIVEFLKLHYVLSRRQDPYWLDHRRAETIPPRLADLLDLWRYQPPSDFDLPSANEVFPAASYQYILYGMGSRAPDSSLMKVPDRELADHALTQVHQRTRSLAAGLPTNRVYLDALRQSKSSTLLSKEMNG